MTFVEMRRHHRYLFASVFFCADVEMSAIVANLDVALPGRTMQSSQAKQVTYMQ